MLRLTIITADTTDILPVSGMLAFLDLFQIKDKTANDATKLNRAFTLDTAFVNSFATIKTYQGFPTEEKDKIHHHLKYRVGQKCIITTRWLSRQNPANSLYWTQIVEALNAGHPLHENQLLFLQKHKIEYTHSASFFN